MNQTLDEWSELFAKDLKEDIDTHIDVMTTISEYERKALVRLILISVRQWGEEAKLPQFLKAKKEKK